VRARARGLCSSRMLLPQTVYDFIRGAAKHCGLYFQTAEVLSVADGDGAVTLSPTSGVVRDSLASAARQCAASLTAVHVLSWDAACMQGSLGTLKRIVVPRSHFIGHTTSLSKMDGGTQQTDGEDGMTDHDDNATVGNVSPSVASTRTCGCVHACVCVCGCVRVCAHAHADVVTA